MANSPGAVELPTIRSFTPAFVVEVPIEILFEASTPMAPAVVPAEPDGGPLNCAEATEMSPIRLIRPIKPIRKAFDKLRR